MASISNNRAPRAVIDAPATILTPETLAPAAEQAEHAHYRTVEKGEAGRAVISVLGSGLACEEPQWG